MGGPSFLIKKIENGMRLSAAKAAESDILTGKI
jgi:hypothetical protein